MVSCAAWPARAREHACVPARARCTRPRPAPAPSFPDDPPKVSRIPRARLAGLRGFVRGVVCFSISRGGARTGMNPRAAPARTMHARPWTGAARRLLPRSAASITLTRPRPQASLVWCPFFFLPRDVRLRGRTPSTARNVPRVVLLRSIRARWFACWHQADATNTRRLSQQIETGRELASIVTTFYGRRPATIYHAVPVR